MDADACEIKAMPYKAVRIIKHLLDDGSFQGNES